MDAWHSFANPAANPSSASASSLAYARPFIVFSHTDDVCPANRTAHMKKRRRVEPIPPYSFPRVVEKGLVSDTEARELYYIFFSRCHLFIPLFDPAYDTYEGLKTRAPWCFAVALAVASKIRAGNGPPSATFYKGLDEAPGIARSTLDLRVCGGEGGPPGHAAPRGVEHERVAARGPCPAHGARFILHNALEKLADASGKRRSEEERHLVVSARIWLCLYWFDHQCVCVVHGLWRSC